MCMLPFHCPQICVYVEADKDGYCFPLFTRNEIISMNAVMQQAAPYIFKN
jgi:hypothetical protein